MENADRAVVKCFNCDETVCINVSLFWKHSKLIHSQGHRVRDCTQARPDKFACRNCKQSGHSSKECTEPRSAEGVECKNCNESKSPMCLRIWNIILISSLVGHFSKDCPTRVKFACRNCGSEDHKAKGTFYYVSHSVCQVQIQRLFNVSMSLIRLKDVFAD
jgi:hypothetical protein